MKEPLIHLAIPGKVCVCGLIHVDWQRDDVSLHTRNVSCPDCLILAPRCERQKITVCNHRVTSTFACDEKTGHSGPCTWENRAHLCSKCFDELPNPVAPCTDDPSREPQ